MIVIDASVILHALIEIRDNSEIQRLLESSGGVIAPHIIDAEVINGIRKNLRLKTISPERANFAIGDLQNMPIDRKSTKEFNQRIWELRDNFTPYDATYLALAESYGAQLFTRDQKLASAVKAHTKVTLV